MSAGAADGRRWRLKAWKKGEKDNRPSYSESITGDARLNVALRGIEKNVEYVRHTVAAE